MDEEPYGALAAVYDWLVPEALLTPRGSAAAFAPLLGTPARGARILDCAAGTGQLAVGLALEGFDVVATDASPAMIAGCRALAAEHGVAIATAVCAWEHLAVQGWDGAFDAVLCVGNSLVHAAGREHRRAALRAMRSVLRDGGTFVVTSRDSEAVRAAGSRLEVDERVVVRHGRRGLVIRAWSIAPGWDERHDLDVAVALLADDGTVATTRERLGFWPFRHDDLLADLAAGGLAPVDSTHGAAAGRYAVTARACPVP